MGGPSEIPFPLVPWIPASQGVEELPLLSSLSLAGTSCGADPEVLQRLDSFVGMTLGKAILFELARRIRFA